MTTSARSTCLRARGWGGTDRLPTSWFARPAWRGGGCRETSSGRVNLNLATSEKAANPRRSRSVDGPQTCVVGTKKCVATLLLAYEPKTLA
jgi:hypothetical protein